MTTAGRMSAPHAPGRGLSGLGWAGVGVVAGLAVGFMTVRTSPETIAVAIIGVVTAVIVIRRPEVGALAVVCLALAVPRDLLFERGLSIGGGSLKITDLLIALSLGGWIAHRAIDPRARRLPSVPVIGLVLGIVGVSVLSLLTNEERGGGLQLGLTDLRPFVALLLVFPLVAFLVEMPSLVRALTAVLAACAVGGLWISVLYLAGEGSEASFSSGALRITEVSFVAPMIGTIWALVLLPHCRRTTDRVAASLLAVLSLTALFFTLQRAAWLALFLAAATAAVLMTPRRRARLLGSLIVVAACASVAILSLNAASSARVENPFQSGLERLQSVGSYETDVSALHREAETREALTQIRRHPFAGIGLGGALTFYSPLFNAGTGQPGVQVTTTYLHNSYTWMAVKTGIPGLALLVGLVGLILVRGTRMARRGATVAVRVGALGCVASVAALAVVSFTGPHLTSDLGVPYLATIVAAIDAFWRIGGPGRLETSG